MKRAHVITVLIFLLFGSLAVLFFLDRSDQDDKIASPQIGENELGKEAYNKVRDELIDTMHDHGARESLLMLRERIKSDSATLRSCHSLVHELGHESYEFYGDFATSLLYTDDICNSGYLHGVIEAHFSKSGDIFATMMNVCDSYPKGKFLSWECFHGVGHGVMYYSANDLPKSLSYCEQYDGAFSRSSCVNGVFMENFNTEQKDHISKYLNPEDPFYPCHEQKKEFQNDCFVYAPTYYLSLNDNDYKVAFDWCNLAPDEFIETCIHGIGSQAIKENINEPLLVEKTCLILEGDLRVACIRGLVGLYINHFGSLQEAQELCPKLETGNREVCNEEIRTRSYLF